MNYETILVAHRGPSALITLNRPEKLNAMSHMMKEEMIRALRDLDADDGTRAIVITGAGQKSFTAGADIHEFHGRTPMEQWRMYEHGTLYDAVDRSTKPVIAMINGYCFGGGLELAAREFDCGGGFLYHVLVLLSLQPAKLLSAGA